MRTFCRQYCRTMAAILLALLLCTACSQNGRPASGVVAPLAASDELPSPVASPPLLFCSLVNLDTTLNASLARGIQDAGIRLGLDVEMHHCFGDGATQVMELEQFAERGVPGYVVCQPVNYAPLAALFERLEEMDIPVVTVGPQAGAHDAGALMPDYDLGIFLAENLLLPYVADTLGGRAYIAVLEYPQTVDSPVSRAAGIADAVAEQNPAAVVTRYVAGEDWDETMQAIWENGAPDILVGADDTLALQALHHWKKTQEDEADIHLRGEAPLFVGIDGTPAGISAVQDEPLFGATLEPGGEEAGNLLAERAFAAASGTRPGGAPAAPVLIDKENVWDFLPA